MKSYEEIEKLGEKFVDEGLTFEDMIALAEWYLNVGGTLAVLKESIRLGRSTMNDEEVAAACEEAIRTGEYKNFSGTKQKLVISIKPTE
jgi:predicted DNA-binding protein